MAQSSLEILISAINQASGPIQDVVNDINGMQQGARDTLEVGERITNFGRQYVDGVSRPIMQGLGASLNAAIELESAMSDTNKALGVQPNTDGAKALQTEIMNLSGELGQMPAAIAGFYTEAGKLGIQRGQMADYTRLVNQAGVAWDMTSEQAGSAVSTLSNVMGLFDSRTGTVNLQGLQQLGDTINFLADSGATSESAIAQVLQRSGSTMRMFGFLNQESAALATGFLNLGYPPEVVGTAMNGMLPKLQNATQQTNDFQEALESIGLPAAQFEQMVKKDATGAITTLLDAAAKSGDTGIFQKLFGTGSDSALLTAAAQNLENFKGTLQSIDKVTSGGMGASYENRLKTTQAQMESFRAQMFILGASIGSALLPPLNAILSALTPIVTGFANFAAANPAITQIGVALALVVAAIGPIIVGVGMLISALGALQAAFAAGGIFAAGGMLAGVGTAVAAIAASALPIIGIIAAIAAGAYLIYANWGSISTFFAGIFAQIQSFLSGFAAGFTAAIAPAMPAIQSIAASFQQWWMAISQIGAAIGSIVMGLAQFVMAASQLTPMGIMLSQIGAGFQSAGMSAQVFGAAVGGAAAAVIGAIANIAARAMSLVATFASVTAGIVSQVASLAGQMFAAGQNIVQSIARGITAGAGAVRSAISGVMSMVRGALPFSPPEWGPLSDIMQTGGNIVNSIAGGIVPGPVQTAMASAMAPVSSMMAAPSASPIPLGNSGGAGIPAGGGGGMSLTYAPQVTLGPGANPQDFRAMLEQHRDEIGRLMGDIQRREARINYAGA